MVEANELYMPCPPAANLASKIAHLPCGICRATLALIVAERKFDDAGSETSEGKCLIEIADRLGHSMLWPT